MRQSTPAGRPVRSRLARLARRRWPVALAVGAAGLFVYPFIDSEGLSKLVYYSIGIIAIGVAVMGAMRRPAATRKPWLALAGGLELFVLGDLVWDVLDLAGTDMTVSLADPVYVAGYLLIVWALVDLLGLRRARTADVVDAVIVTVALASVLWVLIAESIAGLDHLSAFMAGLYPVLDLVLLGVVLTSLFQHRRPSRVTGALTAAMLAMLAADQAYGFAGGEPLVTASIEIGWLGGYLLLAAAAASRKPVSRMERSDDPSAAVGWSSGRLVLLLSAATVPLFSMLVELQRQGTLDAGRAATASATMFALLVFRMELVIRGQRGLLRERHDLLASLQRQAVEDPLTGLANRRALFDHLGEPAASLPPGVVLMVLDLDDFKAVNDSLGHPVGDALLSIVADRLRGVVRSEDVVARLGGDEFAIVAHGCSSDAQVATLAQRVLGIFDAPVELAGRSLVVGASMGVAATVQGDESVEDLLRDADSALYEAKDRGKHRWVVFDPRMRVRALRRLSFDGELARAVAEREFELAYQPIVSLTTGGIGWLEALLRWNHPSLGLLGPGEFLHAAERTRHMAAIARWVLDEAVAAAGVWRREGHAEVGVSVNVSAAQLEDGTVVDALGPIIGAAGLPPGRLMLELLGSSFETTGDLVARLRVLRDLGLTLAIDDVGSGFSSLARLSELPVGVLKLDRSLVVGHRDVRMVGGVVRLARSLGLRVVAEGIETPRDLDRMRGLGCDDVQGYAISRPLPAGRVLAFLRSWDPARLAAPNGGGPLEGATSASDPSLGPGFAPGPAPA